MALLLIEGFDQFDDYIECGRAYIVGNGATFTFPAGRIDGNCLRMPINSGSIHLGGFKTSDTAVVGFAYKADAPISAHDIVRFLDIGTEQIVLRIDGTGGLIVDRGTTFLGTSTGLTLVQDVWYYIELEVLFANGTGGTVDVWVNGINEISLSSIDTMNTANAYATAVSFSGSGNAQPMIDDVYVLDDTGTDNTARLGDAHIETIQPDADGATNNFTRVGGGTNNYQAVDDMAPPDDDTTYNHSATATHKELYGFAALTGNIDTIFAVEVSALMRKEDAGYRGIRTVARSNVTEVESADKGVSMEYAYKGEIYENDPNGGGDWTESAVNAAQFGVKIQT